MSKVKPSKHEASTPREERKEKKPKIQECLQQRKRWGRINNLQKYGTITFSRTELRGAREKGRKWKGEPGANAQNQNKLSRVPS